MKNGFKNLLVECSGKQGWNGAAPVIGLCKMRRTREYIYSVGLAGGEGRGSANSRKKRRDKISGDRRLQKNGGTYLFILNIKGV